MESFDLTTRLMLVDDHDLVRDGVRATLERTGRYEICGEAGTAREALQRLDELQVDVVVMDVRMPGMDGIEAAGEVTRTRPHLRTLMLSMHASEGYARRAFEAGAAGYCTKQSGRAELLNALGAVRRGGTYFSPELGPGATAEPSAARRLSPRQRQTLELIALGCTSKDIARQLSISVKTVESHRTALMRQLDLHEMASLVRYAVSIGLVPADAEPTGLDRLQPARY